MIIIYKRTSPRKQQYQPNSSFCLLKNLSHQELTKKWPSASNNLQLGHLLVDVKVSKLSDSNLPKTWDNHIHSDKSLDPQKFYHGKTLLAIIPHSLPHQPTHTTEILPCLNLHNVDQQLPALKAHFTCNIHTVTYKQPLILLLHLIPMRFIPQ